MSCGGGGGVGGGGGSGGSGGRAGALSNVSDRGGGVANTSSKQPHAQKDAQALKSAKVGRIHKVAASLERKGASLKKTKDVSKQDTQVKTSDTGGSNEAGEVGSFGSSDHDFVEPFLRQLASFGSQQIEADGFNFVVSIVRGIKPRDQTEAMLGAQMAAIHNATMTMQKRLAHVESIAQQDSAVRALNNLARTYALQMEALKRYRSSGQQQVVVKHVTVNEGGQAIVGNVGKGDHRNDE